MLTRILILSGCLLSGAAYLRAGSVDELVVPREPLGSFPLELGSWKGEALPDLEREVVAILGTDEYINRTYARNPDRSVGLYVGYYSTQRQGDSIHSPLNCLPGAGWHPVSHGYSTVPVDASRSIDVNRYVVEKDAARVVVLYWYQSHGRVVPSEYWSKLYLVYDALRLNRTDAALVRVVSPVLDTDSDERAAGLHGEEFVRAMFHTLGRFLPS
jgi:EpsI family protein